MSAYTLFSGVVRLNRGHACPESQNGVDVRIALLYLLFAAIATATNLLAQAAVVRMLDGTWAVAAGVLVGTLAGLAVKYVLDRRYIFRFRSRSLSNNMRTVVMYTLFSVVTTVIFWGFEFGFDWIFGTEAARYTGAVIGLGIGYAAKYQLDRRYTFVEREG
ncbi:GtrA family protein [Leucobacter sp. VD1]|uniref:GtrA family protein n=1 Tax=Leucobacter sp. VD1 TaxID=3080381 RepID=UPI003016845D